jgi:hypothetical protein
MRLSMFLSPSTLRLLQVCQCLRSLQPSLSLSLPLLHLDQTIAVSNGPHPHQMSLSPPRIGFELLFWSHPYSSEPLMFGMLMNERPRR